MNNLLPYEEQIAGKLAELPLPNLEDAIWARIETMLDADAATDDTEGPYQSVKNRITAKTIINKKTIAFLILIAMIACIIIIRKQKNEKPPQKQKIIIPPISTKETKDSVGATPGIPNVKRRKPQKDSPNLNTYILPDTTAAQPVIINYPRIDSSVKKQAPAIVPPKKDSAMKKPRGVPGISDSDYRLKAQKKDSIHNQ